MQEYRHIWRMNPFITFNLMEGSDNFQFFEIACQILRTIPESYVFSLCGDPASRASCRCFAPVRLTVLTIDERQGHVAVLGDLGICTSLEEPM